MQKPLVCESFLSQGVLGSWPAQGSLGRRTAGPRGGRERERCWWRPEGLAGLGLVAWVLMLVRPVVRQSHPFRGEGGRTVVHGRHRQSPQGHLHAEVRAHLQAASDEELVDKSVGS